uniref:Protein BCP1 n=1 Tax=Aureoumbra lagunensis TaxID=44058 RepID=A0A7S3NLY7_9STRA|mmetsp:Transcript_7623/g.11455  ORF Transcript_7623/g.11455 Transcript_7623/m.11455 type:complete len:273 (+) Transcript_7623:43-861(+)
MNIEGPKRKKEEEDVEMSEEEEEEEDDGMRLDSVIQEEGVEDIVFDFDDPQEKHFDSIRGILFRNTIAKCVNNIALNDLSDLIANDPASAGTVVEVADHEVICFAAVVNLQHYNSGANTGVDAIRNILSLATTDNLRAAASPDSRNNYAFLARGYLVNVPPKIIATTYRLLRDDLAKMQTFRGFILLVRGEDPTSHHSKSTPAFKKHATAIAQCDSFDDDCFVAAASEHFSLNPTSSSAAASISPGGRISAIYLDIASFSAAVDEIIQLSEL